MAIEIDNDNGEIRVDGYEYASTKVKVKTYGISSESSQTGNSADLRLTDSDGYTDNVTFTGGSNVTIVRTDANKITISASANDTNTTYGISAETNVTPKSADLRLTGSDASTDNITLVGGTNVTVTRTDANTITFSATDIDTNTKYSVSAESSQTGNSADIRLTDSDGYTDNVTITGGSNVSIVRNSENQLTVSSSYTGFGAFTDGYNTANADQAIDTINFAAGVGIKLAVDSGADKLTIENDGVTTFNGSKGNISYNAFGAISDGNNTAIADWPMDTLQINSGTGISFVVDGYTDSATVTNTGVTQFNGATGNISYYSFGSISDGYNIATADQANDSILFVPGSGIGVVVNTPGDNVTISNTGVTQATAGTGISVSSGTGNVTINNTGVTAITAGTGITTSGSGNITVNNDGVTTFNTAKGAITYNSFGTMSDGTNTAVADLANDTFTFVPGTGIGVLVSSASDNITISNTGVTSLNGGTGARYTYSTFTDGATPTTASAGNTTMTLTGSNGIKVTTSPNTATITMTETTFVRGSDLTIAKGSTANVIATGSISQNKTIEISGIIMFSFAVLPPAVNTFDIILSTGTGTIGANTSKAAIGFTSHAGVTAASLLEASKQTPSATYPQQIANTNIHVIRFSGIFQTDGTTATTLIVSMKNNNNGAGTEDLIVYAKSFIRYNEI